MAREIAPVSPGEMLQEEFLRPLGLSQYALAKAIGVPPAHQRDRAWHPVGDGRYRPALVPLLRLDRWLVAALASEVRQRADT